MPQCHNPKLQENNPMGVLTMTESSRRKIETIQRLEKKREDFHMAIASRNNAIWNHKVGQMRSKLKDSLKRTEAYRAVMENRSFSKLQDLDRKYTFKSLRGDINNAMIRMHPSFIRAQRTKIEINRARRTQEEVMQHNIETARTSFRHEAIQEAIAKTKEQQERREWEMLVSRSSKLQTPLSLPPISARTRPGTYSRTSSQTEDGIVASFVGQQKDPSPDLIPASRRKRLISEKLPPLGAIQDAEEVESTT